MTTSIRLLYADDEPSLLSITGITIRESGEPGKGPLFEMMVPKGAWK